jgi:hypothetical protein
MPLTVPTTIFPTEERFVNVVREAAATPGTIPATTGTTFPIVNFDPEDKPIWLPDESLRGSMAQTYDFLQGPVIADTSVGGPVYVDMLGHELYNILGDYQQTGTAAAPNTTTNAPIVAGATTISVLAGASFTVGMFIQVDVAPFAEIVKVLSAVAATITLDPTTPLRLNHLTSVAVTNTTVAANTYSHVFSLLNSSAVAGTTVYQYGQPPTHTWTDRTQVPATGLARQYAFGCLSSLTLTGNSEKLLEWNGSLVSFKGVVASAPPVASVSAVHAYPDFTTLIGLNGIVSGAPIYDIQEWSVTINRQVEPFFTNDGSPNPYTIGRGKLDVIGKLVFSPAVDETALLYMLNNTQPQLQIQATNGKTAQNLQQVQFDVIFCDFDTSKINASRSLFGYEVTFKTTATASTANGVTTTGWSGGQSPLKVTVNNLVPVY